jgi:RND family efflux transporter MFP subunit
MTTETMGAPPRHPHLHGRGLLWLLVALLVGTALLVAAIVLIKRSSVRRHARALQAQFAAGPHVQVVAIAKSPDVLELTVQGEVRPWYSSTVFAKIPGFVRTVNVDKGDRVKAGQVLATIESPETDRQVQAARADAANKRNIAARYRLLVARDYVSAQDFQSSLADARVSAETARQVRAIDQYKILRAPFDGVVTARYSDPGALLSTGASSPPVVTVSRDDTLRVFAYVDQRHAQSVRVGDEAVLSLPETREPQHAKVARIAGALDPRTRMLLVEVDLVNRLHLVPGGFCDVQLRLHESPSLAVPSETLILHGRRSSLAIVDENDRVHFREVTVLSDDGTTARLDPGGAVKAGERAAVGLGERVAEGAKVQPVAAPAKRGG